MISPSAAKINAILDKDNLSKDDIKIAVGLIKPDRARNNGRYVTVIKKDSFSRAEVIDAFDQLNLSVDTEIASRLSSVK